MASRLLVVIGSLEDEDHIKKVVKNVETGIEKWMVSMPLDDQEEIVHILKNIPFMKSIPNRNAEDGTVVSRYRGRILDSTVLISPTSENLNDELMDLFLTAPPRCLVSYGGFVTEDNGDWILQDGLFSFNTFQQVCKDSKVVTALSEHSTKVTVSCPELGLWKTTEKIFPAESKITLEIMDSLSSIEMTGGVGHSSTTQGKKQSNFEEFSNFLEDGIGNEIGGVFNTLKPPLQEGFLKIRHPCVYIFPSGCGDSAFFAVNGFNMLVNGGSCTKPWFWKLIQHLDRVDSILATHLGSDNLPGLNSLLLRKLQERQVKLPMDSSTSEYQEMKRCLISPDLGPIFINTPKKFLDNISKSGPTSDPQKTNGASSNSDNGTEKQLVQKTVDIVKDTLRLSKALNMEIVPLARKSSSIEPITLFSKVGLGCLEMYVISPSEGSKELLYMNDKWGCNGKTGTPTGKTGLCDASGHEGDSSVTNLSSICALLVWHPSNPNEKIVRVLFPGNAPQAKIFEGLESLKNLPFLKAQYVTKNSIGKPKHSSKPNGTNVAQKPSRPVNAASLGKKATSITSTRKAAAPAKKETSSSMKSAEKRSKTEKSTTTKAKPAPSTSASSAAKSTAKERLTQKSSKTEQEKPPKSVPSMTKKPASLRPASAPTAPKAESKRLGASAPSKTTVKSKTASASSAKVADKTKKPQTLVNAKQKPEPHRATPKRSAKPPVKKGTPVSKSGDKVVRREKTSPAKVASTPPEDLTAEFAKLDSEKEKPNELQSLGSEEPTTSVLSDRHSPEGEDGSTIQYAESPSLTRDDKLEPEKGEEHHPVEQEDTGFVIMSKPSIISEDSDMISTNGSSAAAQAPTPVEDALLSKQIQNEAELLSSDKSTPEEDSKLPQEVQKEEEMISPEKSTPEKSSEEAQETQNKVITSGKSTADEDYKQPLEVQNEAEMTSSDKLSPEEDGQQPQEVEKAIKFSEPDVDAEQAHKPVERLPTPFHSLQDSSVTSETSPISETETPDALCDIAISRLSTQEEIGMEIPGETAIENNEPDHASGDIGIENLEPTDAVLEEIQGALENEMQQEEGVEEVESSKLDAAATPDKNLHEATEKDVEPLKEMGSEVHSSFNSSIEGSYELYPVEPSPLASAQETIAETISDFKHDEPPAMEDLQGESTCMDTQPQQVEMFEDPTVSTEAPDARYSMSTTSTGSQFARMEPPFSSSDAGLSSVAVDPSVAMQQEHAEFASHEEVVDQDEMPEVDQDVSQGVEKDVEHPEAEEDVVVQITRDDQDYFEHDKLEEQESELLKECPNKEDNGDLVEGHTSAGNEDLASKDVDMKMENYPQQAWSYHEQEYEKCSEEKEVQDKEMHEKELVMEKDTNIHAQSQDGDIEVHIDKEGLDEKHILDPKVAPFDVQVTEDDRQETILMTGSLASSAQDQGQDDESEATSITETADTSEAELHSERDLVDDGPDLKDYESVGSGAIPKSDLMIASMEENFPLHGGTTTGQDLLELHFEPEEKQSSENTPAQVTDLWQQQGDAPVAAPRYHPAYLDPSAPLADTEEVQTGIDQLKAAELDSPLDVHAKPFIPKSSMPLDPSPTYGTEAQFGQLEAFSDDESFEAAEPVQPANTNNPFLVDLMTNNQQDPFNMEDPCLPPNRGSDPCAAQDKTSKSAVKKTGQGSASSGKSQTSPIYLDLVYVPNHGNKSSVGKEFFQKIRAKYYVISGNDQSRDEPSAEVLDHLLSGRRSWFSEASASAAESEDTNVTVIPTHDTQTLREWYKQNFKELESCNIHMVASGSKVMVQVESIEACKIEF